MSSDTKILYLISLIQLNRNEKKYTLINKMRISGGVETL